MTQDRFTLTLADRTHPLWLALSKHLIERRESLRRQNDASLPPEATEKLRGRIAQITELLSLAEDRPPVT